MALLVLIWVVSYGRPSRFGEISLTQASSHTIYSY